MGGWGGSHVPHTQQSSSLTGMGGWGGSHVPHTTDLLRALPSQGWVDGVGHMYHTHNRALPSQGWVDGVGHMYHTQQTCLELFPHRDGWMGWVGSQLLTYAIYTYWIKTVIHTHFVVVD